MTHIPVSLERRVRARAANRCEYCGLSQEGQEALFHIDHVVPVAACGETVLSNLALACVSCSLRKGDRQTALDPESGGGVPIYNPRTQRFSDHFRWDGSVIVGESAVGRATAAALSLNRPSIVAIRAEDMMFGRHPPPLVWADRAPASDES